MSWLNVNNTTKISKQHLDEIVSRLNEQRSLRSYSTISLPITANITKILHSHIMSIRSTIDSTPSTVGCSTHNGLVYSAQNSNYRTSNNGVVKSSVNLSVYSTTWQSRNSSYYTVCSHNTVVKQNHYQYKATCFIFMEK